MLLEKQRSALSSISFSLKSQARIGSFKHEHTASGGLYKGQQGRKSRSPFRRMITDVDSRRIGSPVQNRQESPAESDYQKKNEYSNLSSEKDDYPLNILFGKSSSGQESSSRFHKFGASTLRLPGYSNLNQHSSKSSLPKPSDVNSVINSASRQTEKSNLMQLIGRQAKDKQTTNPDISKANLANLMNTLTEASTQRGKSSRKRIDNSRIDQQQSLLRDKEKRKTSID